MFPLKFSPENSTFPPKILPFNPRSFSCIIFLSLHFHLFLVKSPTTSRLLFPGARPSYGRFDLSVQGR
ncbi:hypothetical protein AKJ16_DCAP01871 [Drosera capensis]